MNHEICDVVDVHVEQANMKTLCVVTAAYYFCILYT